MEDGKLAVLETLMTDVRTDLREVKGDLKEIRQENENWRREHEKATQQKIDHARRNTDQKFQALEAQIAERVTKADLQANQEESDERYREIKSSHAGKWTEKTLAAIGMAIVMAFVGVLIKVAMPEDRSQRQTAPIHAPVAPTTQAASAR